MSKQNRHAATAASASLLARQASGGDVAGSGFTFQDNAILARIPMWLSRDGFTAMIREALGDTEARFFTPGRGDQIELVESKNHRLVPTEFWAEIDRFQELDFGAPGTYGWFTLVCAGLSEELQPLVNGLRRIRGAYGFYGRDTQVHAESFAGFVEVVRHLGRTEADARFIFERVLLDTQQAEAQDHGEGLFIEAIGRWLPEYQKLPLDVLRRARLALVDLLRSRTCQTITRLEIEGRLHQVLPDGVIPPPRPVSLYTSAVADSAYSGPALVFNLAEFFGGSARSYPAPAEWERHVLGPLRATRDWIAANRATRRIHLQGDRRLSTAFCTGAVFSAVAGFTIDMDYRGEIWPTDAYPDGGTPRYHLEQRLTSRDSDCLVVSIGIAKSIAAQVESDLARHDLNYASVLHLHGSGPIVSAAHANAAVQAIKAQITSALLLASGSAIHLFYAGPSHLALFLGHRLNATAHVQCYEWVSSSAYVPTCCIT